MAEKLLIDLVRMRPEGERFEGEADIVDIDESFVHPFGGVRYSLKAQLFGTELVVQGKLEQDFDLVCSRCGKDFDTTIHVDDFTMSMEVAGNAEFADITQEAREAVLLELPNFPLCDEACEGLEQKSEMAGDARWGALDGVKIS
ncbi:MAG: hypothetical protein J6P13_05245 [Kiritimatiellae bacterium]|nr:hypothetical protein [Kiritimatiellia bacterium]